MHWCRCPSCPRFLTREGTQQQNQLTHQYQINLGKKHQWIPQNWHFKSDITESSTSPDDRTMGWATDRSIKIKTSFQDNPCVPILWTIFRDYWNSYFLIYKYCNQQKNASLERGKHQVNLHNFPWQKTRKLTRKLHINLE